MSLGGLVVDCGDFGWSDGGLWWVWVICEGL